MNYPKLSKINYLSIGNINNISYLHNNIKDINLLQIWLLENTKIDFTDSQQKDIKAGKVIGFNQRQAIESANALSLVILSNLELEKRLMNSDIRIKDEGLYPA